MKIARPNCRWILFAALFAGVFRGAVPLAYAGDKRLAVLEFQGKKIDEETLKTLSDAVRGGALEGLGGQTVDVMTRENMIAMLKAMGKRECSEGECEVETARNIGADFVVSGIVVRIEDRYVVTLKLHECKNGSLLGTEMVKARTQLGILDSLRERSGDLVRIHIPRSPAPSGEGGQATGTSSDFTTVDNRVFVRFESEPAGAAVLVDGSLACRETPCVNSISPGRHEVEMRRERYARTQQTVEARQGAIVHLTLAAELATGYGTLPPATPQAQAYPPSGRTDEAALSPSPLPPSRPAPVARAEATPDSSAQTHQGLFLQFLIGPAYLVASETQSGSNVKFYGFGAALSAALGWTLARNFIVFGEIGGSDAMDADYSADGVGGGTSGYNLILVGMGPGAAYYLESENVYFSGSLTVSRLSFENRSSGAKENTDYGVGANVVVGKEWFVGRHMGIGIAGQLQAAVMNDPYYNTALSALSASVLFSFTLN